MQFGSEGGVSITCNLVKRVITGFLLGYHVITKEEEVEQNAY